MPFMPISRRNLLGATAAAAVIAKSVKAQPKPGPAVSDGFQIEPVLPAGQLRPAMTYSERATTTVSGPVAMAGSTERSTQRAPELESVWRTCCASAACAGPPLPSLTTTNSARWAFWPASTIARSSPI